MSAPALLRLRFELAIWRRGAWVVVCLLLAVACVVLVAGVLWPLRDDVRHLQVRRDAQAGHTGTVSYQVPKPAGDDRRVDVHPGLSEVLLPRSQALQEIEDIRRLVEFQWQWAEAAFVYHEQDVAGLARVEVTVKSTSRYPALRQALVRMLADHSNVSIDRMKLQAMAPPDGRLSTQVTFTLWLATTESPKRAPLNARSPEESR